MPALDDAPSHTTTVRDDAAGRPWRALGPLFGALGFLTRVPVVDWAQRDLAHAAPLFPIVGALIGAAVGGSATLLALAVPPLAAAGLAVGVELLVTGALHLDGLADSADGLAGRGRAHTLAIMRDHAIGTYGACALGLDLIVKTAALAALSNAVAIPTVIAAYAVSRAAALPLAAALGPARPDAGVGRLLAGRLGLPPAALGIVLAAAIAVAATGWRAAPTLACLAAVTGAVGLAARRRLGGVTGDAFGAAIELSATLALVVAAGLEP